MIRMLYEPPPDCIHADGRDIPVLTDFRAWLQFLDLMSDRELRAEDKMQVLDAWLVKPEPLTREIVEGLTGFCRAGEPAPKRGRNAVRKPPTFDWAADAGFIIADFRRSYGIDLLRVDYLHWWEFRALFFALPEDSAVARRVSLRSVDLSRIKDKDRRREVAEMQRRIALPFALDDADIAAAFDF